MNLLYFLFAAQLATAQVDRHCPPQESFLTQDAAAFHASVAVLVAQAPSLIEQESSQISKCGELMRSLLRDPRLTPQEMTELKALLERLSKNSGLGRGQGSSGPGRHVGSGLGRFSGALDESGRFFDQTATGRKGIQEGSVAPGGTSGLGAGADKDRARIVALEEQLAQQERVVAMYESQTKVDVKLRNDLMEARVTAPLYEDHEGVMTLSGRGGAFGMGGRESYGMLKTSPYGTMEFGFHLKDNAPIELQGRLAYGRAQVNSQRIFPAAVDLRSPGARSDDRNSFTQDWQALSGYVDFGKGFSLAKNVGAAVFASMDYWIMGVGGPSDDSLCEGNIGTALAFQLSKKAALRLAAGLQVQSSPPSMYRNDPNTIGVEGRYLKADITQQVGPGQSVSVALDMAMKSYATQFNPKVTWTDGQNTALLEGYVQKSRNPFFPNETGGLVRAGRELIQGMTASLEAYYLGRNQVRGAASSESGLRGTLSFALNQPDVAPRVSGTVSYGDTSTPYNFSPDLAKAKSQSISGQTQSYSIVDRALRDAPDFERFTAALAGSIRTYDEMLGMLRLLGETFSFKNYNEHEDASPNQNTPQGIYSQVRASWLDGIPRPAGVCITQSQFDAVVVNELSKLKGWGVEAMVATFNVPDDKGNAAGHGVLVIRGPDGNITFQDWSRIMPTGTADAYTALRIYQGLQGIPSPLWDYATPEGKNAARVFSPEGRLAVESLTVLDAAAPQSQKPWDRDPRGIKITQDRMLDAAQRSSLQSDDAADAKRQPLAYVVAKLKALNLRNALAILKQNKSGGN